MINFCPWTINSGRKRRKLRSKLILCGLKPIYVLLFLSTTFTVAFITFFITFYRNSDSLLDLYYYLSSKPHPFGGPRSLNVLIGNYQPRSFTGKEQSVSFDQSIIYQDFNFLQSETLTFEQREYSSREKFFFRFPTKVETWALLFIFHSCNHTANDWFRTVERQRIIGAAVDLGYATLVFQSTDRIHRCWSMNTDIYQNEDIEMVVKILKKFYKEFPKFGKISTTRKTKDFHRFSFSFFASFYLWRIKWRSFLEYFGH